MNQVTIQQGRFQLVPQTDEQQKRTPCSGCVSFEYGTKEHTFPNGGGCHALNRAAKEQLSKNNEPPHQGCMGGSEVNMIFVKPVPGPVLYSSDPDHGDPKVPLGGGIQLEPSPVGSSPSKAHAPVHGGYVTPDHLARAFPAQARVSDPETSKAAATGANLRGTGGKLADLILLALQANVDNPWMATTRQQGLTGKELAESTGRGLNSITPRFAQLSRAGLIHDTGTRRDKQIVWALGNGVKA